MRQDPFVTTFCPDFPADFSDAPTHALVCGGRRLVGISPPEVLSSRQIFASFFCAESPTNDLSVSSQLPEFLLVLRCRILFTKSPNTFREDRRLTMTRQFRLSINYCWWVIHTLLFALSPGSWSVAAAEDARTIPFKQRQLYLDNIAREGFDSSLIEFDGVTRRRCDTLRNRQSSENACCSCHAEQDCGSHCNR